MSAAGAAVSLGAGILSAMFTSMVLGNFFERRKPHNLMWGIGLLMFTLVMFVQVATETQGWSAGLFKAWYLMGTGLVAFLGAGSVYIVHRRLGHVFAAYVVALSVVFVAVVAAAPTNAGALAAAADSRPPGGEAWGAPALPRLFSPLFTIPGSVTLIGIALYGLVRHRLLYNAWIAGGALVLAVGTGLPRFGVEFPMLIYAAEFAGIALMFVGFWKAVEWAKEHRRSAAGGGPPPTEGKEPATTVETAPK